MRTSTKKTAKKSTTTKVASTARNTPPSQYTPEERRRIEQSLADGPQARPVTGLIAEKLPRRPSDTAALATLHDEGTDLLSQYRTVEAALRSSDAHDYCNSIAVSVRLCTDRLQDLLDRLEEARGGQVVRDGDDAAQVTS